MMCTPHRRAEWRDPGAVGMPEVATAEQIFLNQNPSYNFYPNLITPPAATGTPFITFWPKTARSMTVDVHWFAPEGAEGHELWPTRMSNFERILEEDTQFAPRIQESVETGGLPGHLPVLPGTAHLPLARGTRPSHRAGERAARVARAADARSVARHGLMAADCRD